jgi:hypothetical protein
MFFDGKERRAGDAIEEVDDSLLGGLGDGVDAPAVAIDSDERGRSGEVAIPDVVMDSLKMPEAAAGGGVEGEERVGEEVVANAVASVEIEDGGAGGDVDDTALSIEGHAGPVVGSAGGLPCAGRPGFVAVFAGARDGMEGPAEGAGANVEGADVAGRRGMGFGVASSDDDEVFVNEAGSGESDGLLIVRFAQAFAEIDAAVVAEGGNGATGPRVESVEVVEDAGEDAAVVVVGAARPVREAAGGLGCAANGAVVTIDGGVEFPEQSAGGGIEGDDFVGRRAGVEDVSDDEGVGLDVALFSGVVLPRDFELGDVGAVDLRERGVMVAVAIAVVGGPVCIGRGGSLRCADRREADEEECGEQMSCATGKQG